MAAAIDHFHCALDFALEKLSKAEERIPFVYFLQDMGNHSYISFYRMYI